MRQYWPVRKKLAVLDGIVMKGKRIVIPLLITETETAVATQQPHGKRKDKAPST